MRVLILSFIATLFFTSLNCFADPKKTDEKQIEAVSQILGPELPTIFKADANAQELRVFLSKNKEGTDQARNQIEQAEKKLATLNDQLAKKETELKQVKFPYELKTKKKEIYDLRSAIGGTLTTINLGNAELERFERELKYFQVRIKEQWQSYIEELKHRVRAEVPELSQLSFHDHTFKEAKKVVQQIGMRTSLLLNELKALQSGDAENLIPEEHQRPISEVKHELRMNLAAVLLLAAEETKRDKQLESKIKWNAARAVWISELLFAASSFFWVDANPIATSIWMATIVSGGYATERWLQTDGNYLNNNEWEIFTSLPGALTEATTALGYQLTAAALALNPFPLKKTVTKKLLKTFYAELTPHLGKSRNLFELQNRLLTLINESPDSRMMPRLEPVSSCDDALTGSNTQDKSKLSD